MSKSNKLMIKRDKLIGANGEEDGYLSHLFIEALTNVFKGDKFATLLKDIDWDNKKDIECYMVVEGHKVPIDLVCDEWNKQATRMINESAVELIADKLHDVEDVVYNLKKSIEDITKKRLNLPIAD